MSTTTKLRRTLALALAGGALAIGVPAAVAAGGGDDPDAGGATTAPVPGFVQDEQQRPDRPGEDCPERGSDDDSGSAGGATTSPEV